MELNSPQKLSLNYALVFILLFLGSQVIVYYLFSSNRIAEALLFNIIIFIVFIYIFYSKWQSVNINLKQAEQVNHYLSIASEKHELVSKATRDTIWDWNITEKVFTFNKGIEDMFGYKPHEIDNSLEWWFSKIHLEDSLKISVYINAVTNESEDRWQDEYRFLCADGNYKYILDRGFIVKDKLGNITRMIGVMQDVTKQKTEELRLKLLETAITQTKDSILISEKSSIINGIPKVVYANSAFTTITGYEQNEIIGKNPSLFLTRQSVSNYLQLINNALKKETDLTFVGLNQRKNGEKYWIHFTMIPITDNNNKLSHWISIQRDITEDKEREKEREQLITELLQNNKDLKQFSYITSHNLRAPLSNLIGLLHLIEEIPIENEELKELFEGFSKSTHQLNETINDLIKIIVMKDDVAIEKEVIDIETAFKKIKNQLSVLIESKKAKFELDLQQQQVYANAVYFESILLNLITNSLKYSKNDVFPIIKISSKTIDDTVLIMFQDNGIGIDLNKNKSKVFGLYQRFHNHQDSKGLGLYLVKSQIEAMQGSIAIESEVNNGTTFSIILKNK